MSLSEFVWTHFDMTESRYMHISLRHLMLSCVKYLEMLHTKLWFLEILLVSLLHQKHGFKSKGGIENKERRTIHLLLFIPVRLRT